MQSRIELAVSVLLVALVLAVYAPVVGYDFVNYDDGEYVAENPHVVPGLTASGVAWAFGNAYAANWHPLTWLSHMLDCTLFGRAAGGHHLTSVALHAANTVLLFLVLAGTTAAVWQSAFVAALFGLHPLHVESVAWISERKDVLSALFWMLGLWCYWRYAKRPSATRYLVLAAVFALGLMSKPMVVSLPFVLLLLDVWPLRRMDATRPSVRRVVEKVPLLLLATAASVVTVAAQRSWGAMESREAVAFGARVTNAIVTYVRYLEKAVWPAGLSVFYPFHGAPPAWEVAGAALALVAVSVLVLRAAGRRPYLLVGWLWYLGTLVPVIGLVKVGGQSMADRFTYIPLIGIFVMLAWGIPELLARSPARRIALALGATLVVSASALGAAAQVRYWRDSRTLFQHAIAVSDDNYLAHNNLGIALLAEHRVDDAVSEYERAIALGPAHAEGHVNLGMALAEKGRLDDAIAEYRAGLGIEPASDRAHYNLGVALARQGKTDAAIAEYTEALRINPDYANAHSNLGALLAAQDRLDEAIGHYTAALRLGPDLPEAHNNLGIALERVGRLPEAIAHYATAVRLRPGNPEGHYNLASALDGAGRIAEARAEFRTALDLARASGRQALAAELESRLAVASDRRP